MLLRAPSLAPEKWGFWLPLGKKTPREISNEAQRLNSPVPLPSSTKPLEISQTSIFSFGSAETIPSPYISGTPPPETGTTPLTAPPTPPAHRSHPLRTAVNYFRAHETCTLHTPPLDAPTSLAPAATSSPCPLSGRTANSPPQGFATLNPSAATTAINAASPISPRCFRVNFLRERLNVASLATLVWGFRLSRRKSPPAIPFSFRRQIGEISFVRFSFRSRGIRWSPPTPAPLPPVTVPPVPTSTSVLHP